MGNLDSSITSSATLTGDEQFHSDCGHNAPLPSQMDENQDAELAIHYDRCIQQAIRDQALASACLLDRKSYITASDGSSCAQSQRFKIHNVLNCNILVHIVAPKYPDNDRARFALAAGFHKANPTQLLENRCPFLECRWPDNNLQKGDPNHLKELIRRHLMLCDWIESKLEELRTHRPHDNPSHCGLLDDRNVVLPTLRAILMIFWPAAIDSEDSLGNAAVVLTGDDSQMQSGPITLDTLREHQLIGFINNESTAFVPLEQAALFLARLDQQEVAATPSLQIRNQQCAHAARENYMKSAKSMLALSRSGIVSDTEYRIKACEERADENCKAFEGLGYSKLQAALAARVWPGQFSFHTGHSQ